MRKYYEDNEIDFGSSQYYWENNNPYAITKNFHGHIVTLGNEMFRHRTYQDHDLESTEFERFVFDSSHDYDEIRAFRKFIEHGQKFGCVNITNDECDHFDLLKSMYGSIAYIVFEDRSLDKEDPTKKKARHVFFLDEYDLCMLNFRIFMSDESYYGSILDKSISPLPISQMMQTGFPGNMKKKEKSASDILCEKLYRLGFVCNQNFYPTKDQYYSRKAKSVSTLDFLESSELMMLLCRTISSACKPNDNDDDADELRNLFYSCNIVGLGWLPCIFSKTTLNELDRYVLHILDKCGIVSELSKLSINESTPEYEPEIGTTKLLHVFTNGYEKKIPLYDVVEVDANRSFFPCIVKEKNGTHHLATKIDLVEDIPEVEIKKDNDIVNGSERVTAIAKYANGKKKSFSIDSFEMKGVSTDSYFFQSKFPNYKPKVKLVYEDSYDELPAFFNSAEDKNKYVISPSYFDNKTEYLTMPLKLRAYMTVSDRTTF